MTNPSTIEVEMPENQAEVPAQKGMPGEKLSEFFEPVTELRFPLDYSVILIDIKVPTPAGEQASVAVNAFENKSPMTGGRYRINVAYTGVLYRLYFESQEQIAAAYLQLKDFLMACGVLSKDTLWGKVTEIASANGGESRDITD